MALFRSADSISLACANLELAKQWWIRTFDCVQVKVPEDWDNPLPSDVALKFRGEDQPTILLSDKGEAVKEHLQTPSAVPIIYSDKLQKAHEHLSKCGLMPGAIQNEAGAQFFEIRDFEGNLIEIGKEL